MPPQETHNRHIALIIVVVLVVLIGLAFVWYKQNGTDEPQQPQNRDLTEEQMREVLNSLQPKNPAPAGELTAEQVEAMQTLGTSGSQEPTQSSNAVQQEKSILDSLQ